LHTAQNAVFFECLHPGCGYRATDRYRVQVSHYRNKHAPGLMKNSTCSYERNRVQCGFRGINDAAVAAHAERAHQGAYQCTDPGCLFVCANEHELSIHMSNQLVHREGTRNLQLRALLEIVAPIRK
jgi:hypothetical protein